MSVFEDIKKAGIPYESYYSDLYLPDTEQVREILNHNGLKVDKWGVSRFTHQILNEPWLDVAFHYTPYWKARGEN
jgi:hypothetical protein